METTSLGNDVWCVIATGQSLTQEDVDYVRGKCRVIAVSNAYTLAPWADAMVSHDQSWWWHNRKAFDFAGEKRCRFEIGKVEKFSPQGYPRGCNSGWMGVLLAKSKGAKKIILLGFDMHGTHYFGKHPKGLKNTTPDRFKIHISQFRRFPDCDIVNCNPKSALKLYPTANLRDVL